MFPLEQAPEIPFVATGSWLINASVDPKDIGELCRFSTGSFPKLSLLVFASDSPWSHFCCDDCRVMRSSSSSMALNCQLQFARYKNGRWSNRLS